MSTNPPAFKRGKRPNYLSTTNACKLCTPLGACLAFKGIEGAVPLKARQAPSGVHSLQALVVEM